MVLVAAFTAINLSTANADFSGDFAPSNWTYSETNASANGPAGTLTSTQMQITSADWNQGDLAVVPNTTGAYSAWVPSDIGLISFNYSYTTNDRDGSFFDMPSYSVGGVSTQLVATNIPQGGTRTGVVYLDLSQYVGTNLSFSQTCTDCVLGTGVITITGFQATRKASGNTLRVDSYGTASEKNNIVTCTPGKYTFFNGGATKETAKIQSYVYTLIMDGKAVSTISTDNFKTVGSQMFPTIKDNLTGTATLESATWDLKGMSNYSVQCGVYAYQAGANIQSVTSVGYDAVAAAAQAQATAKAQQINDMITNWSLANEALVKKYRDQRLAGKP